MIEEYVIAGSIVWGGLAWLTADVYTAIYNLDSETPFEKRKSIGLLSYMGKHTRCNCHP